MLVLFWQPGEKIAKVKIPPASLIPAKFLSRLELRNGPLEEIDYPGRQISGEGQEAKPNQGASRIRPTSGNGQKRKVAQ